MEIRPFFGRHLSFPFKSAEVRMRNIALWGKNMKSILLGGFLGGLVMFFGGFVAHTLLPLGETGLIQASREQQDAVLVSMRQNFQDGEGIYILPMDREAWTDETKAKPFGERALANPYAFVVYQPQGKDMLNNMGGNLGKEWLTNTLSALLAAFLVSFAAVGFGKRVQLITLLGVFGWLANAVPMWNWYRFPSDFILAGLVVQGIGWLLAGFAIAWALRRFPR